MRSALTILLFLIIYANQSLACSCGRVSVFTGSKGKDLVFSGKVKSVEEAWFTDTLGTIYANTDSARLLTKRYKVLEFTFKVNSVFKGKLHTKEVIIATTGGGANCGNYFHKGKRYLVYAYYYDKNLSFALPKPRPEYLSTHLCTRTKLSRKTWPHEWFLLTISKPFRKNKVIESKPYFSQ